MVCVIQLMIPLCNKICGSGARFTTKKVIEIGRSLDLVKNKNQFFSDRSTKIIWGLV